MRKNKLIMLSVMAVSVSCLLSGCLGQKGEDDPSQVVVVETPTPAPTIAPVATATPTPVPQITTYTSSDKKVSITMPGADWTNRMDEGDTISFESKEGDRILILHGEGEEAMSQAVLPDTRENASALTATTDIEEGKDFEITDYTASTVGEANVYTYTVKYADKEKGGGYSAIENYVIANENEFYSVAGSVKEEKTLADVQKSIKTFKVLNKESGLFTSEEETVKPVKPETDKKEDSDETSEAAPTGGATAGATGMDLYNSEGVAFYVYDNGDGTYTDGAGNYFTMDENGDVYDEWGNYYDHGEFYDGTAGGSDADYSEDYTGDYTEDYDNTEDYTDDYNWDYSESDPYYGGNDYYSGSMDFVTSGGVSFAVYDDGYGNWIDGDGNTFYFDENGVAYDQNGNAYNPAY